MPSQPTRAYATFAAIVFLLQGTTTLAAQLVPAFDRAVPWLLAATQMVPSHSLLHIATGVVALAIRSLGGPRGWWWFALLFGLFYLGLALVGIASGRQLGLALKPFDHPFHVLLGGLGLAAVWLAQRRPAGSPIRRH